MVFVRTGFLEFDLGANAPPLPADATVEVHLIDSGAKTNDPGENNEPLPPTPNVISVSWYPGDGEVTLSDRTAPASSIGTVTTRADGGPEPGYNLDVTGSIRQLLAGGGRYFGLRFDATSATDFESFGTAFHGSDPQFGSWLVFPDEPPDVHVKSVDWRSPSDGGGVTLVYEVKGRELTPAEVTESIVLRWSDVPDGDGTHTAAVVELNPAMKEHTVHIPGIAIGVVPQDGHTHLVAIANFSGRIQESDPTNNRQSQPLVVVEPTLVLTTLSSFAGPMIDMGSDYPVEAHVTNNAAVPLAFTLNWDELYLEDVTWPPSKT